MWQDALTATGVFVFLLGLPASDILAGMDRRAAALGPAVVVWTLATCVPLVWRRRAPLTSVVVTGAVTLGALSSGTVVSPWAVMLAAFSAAYHLRRHRIVLGVGATTWMLAVAALSGEPMAPSDVLTSAGLAALPISLGYALRLQADRARATRLLAEAEAERAQAYERNRVARDVHDLVGHQLSAIRLRALGSRKAGAGADQALEAIADLASEALGQVRSLVRVLREDDQPGLSHLDTLAARTQGVLPVEIALDLGGTSPSPQVQAVAYRVVEEALSNVARHASAHRAEVRISATGNALVITVDDDGPGGPKTPREGNGLRGMRERAARLGGTVSAGPHGPRGWRVRATIPLGES